MHTVFIILNYKTYKDTILLTRELLKQGLGNRQVLIVDNASPNESLTALTEEFRQEKQVEVISSGENGGYAKGNNFGLRYAKKYNPEYACIINNDVHFSMRTIERLEEEYRKIKDVALLSPLQCDYPSGEVTRFLNLKRIPTFWDDMKMSLLVKYAQHVFKPDVPGGNLQEVEIVPGAFLFISYRLFESLGFFYEGTFLFCEERFTAKKIKDVGLHSYLMMDEKYIHAHSGTIGKEASPRRGFKMTFDGRLLYAKKQRRWPFVQVPALYVCYAISQLVFSVWEILPQKIKRLIKNR